MRAEQFACCVGVGVGVGVGVVTFAIHQSGQRRVIAEALAPKKTARWPGSKDRGTVVFAKLIKPYPRRVDVVPCNTIMGCYYSINDCFSVTAGSFCAAIDVLLKGFCKRIPICF